ncbi:MAG: hypothetical protein AB1348_05320, partial [Nitrospirota bacterium]
LLPPKILIIMNMPYDFFTRQYSNLFQFRVQSEGFSPPRPETLIIRLDLFDQQDLTAYVTNAHHCLIEAVEKLMLNIGQDPSRIDRKSRGFLGIS